MATQTEMFNRALTIVGAVGSGQTAASEDVGIARLAFAKLVAELDALQVVSIVLTNDESSDEIPEELFQSVAAALAIDIYADFGGPIPSDEARENARNMIKRIVATRPTYEILRADYF
jgi:hypothetical protein